jgi:hypothetical protein
MAGMKNYIENFNGYKASKAVLFWSCAGCVAAAIIVGFNWGGWVTGGTASKMAASSAESARAEIAAGLCVNRFTNATDAKDQLAKLKGSDTWKRTSFLDEGGWTTLPGMEKPISGAASLCAEKLIVAGLPKAAGS